MKRFRGDSERRTSVMNMKHFSRKASAIILATAMTCGTAGGLALARTAAAAPMPATSSAQVSPSACGIECGWSSSQGWYCKINCKLS